MQRLEPGIVRMHTYNPYEDRYPGRRVLSTAALLFAKQMRQNGHTVIIEPDNGAELNCILQYNIQEALSDPLWAYLIGIPTSFALSVAANILYECIKKPPDTIEANVALEFSDEGIRYSHTGADISDYRFKEMLNALERRANNFAQVNRQQPPEPHRPFPVLEEHKAPVVGWAKAWESGVGVQVDMKITNTGTLERIDSGQLRGVSMGGLIRRATCSTCNQSYLECNHRAGVQQPQDTTVIVQEVDLAEISLVHDPVNPLDMVRIRRPGEED